MLVETNRDNRSGMLKGLSANYLPIQIDADDTYQNTLVEVTIEKVCQTHLTGGLTQNPKPGQPREEKK